MAVLFALLAAVGWGSSDYAAGDASRRSSAVSVVVLTHLASCVALVFISVVPGQTGSPRVSDLVWGLAAGLAGGTGAMLLFRGLGRGSMSVVAPVTATGAALVPAFVGLVQGESLGSIGVLGVVVALAAIVLVSVAGADHDDADVDAASLDTEEREVVGADEAPAVNRAATPSAALALPPPTGAPVSLAPPTPAVATPTSVGGSVAVLERNAPVRFHSPMPPPPPIPPWLEAVEPQRPEPPRSRGSLARALRQPGMTDALFSGLGFGLFFVLIAQTSESAGHWPLVAARFVSVVMFAAIAIVTLTPVFPARASRPPVVLAGALDAAAAVCFVLSTRAGLLSVGAVLASLYPAVTVLLARFVGGERITRLQLGGLILAGAAISLLAI